MVTRRDAAEAIYGNLLGPDGQIECWGIEQISFRLAKAATCHVFTLDRGSTGARGACSQGAFDFAEAISSERAFLWDTARGVERRVAQAGERQSRPCFDRNLPPDEQSYSLRQELVRGARLRRLFGRCGP